jgi:hypothetical protein
VSYLAGGGRGKVWSWGSTVLAGKKLGRERIRRRATFFFCF